MKNLFIACTPYQCINATAIALEKNNDINDLLIIKNFNVNKDLLKNLEKIFTNIYYIDNILLSDKTLFSKLQRDKKLKDEMLFLKEVLIGNEYNTVFAATEFFIYSQFFIKSLLKTGARYVHYEDGSFEYAEAKVIRDISKLRIIKELRWYMKLKSKFDFYEYPAQPDWVSEILLTFPDNCRTELELKKRNLINHQNFMQAIKHLFPVQQNINSEVLVCLDLGNTNQDVIEQNQLICKVLKDLEISTAIKYHPRELDENEYILNYSNEVIDKSLPFEGVYINFNGILIANMSSTLHTAKFIAPDNVIICTALLTQKQGIDLSYINFLDKIGVKLPKTFEEFKKILLEIKQKGDGKFE